MDDNEGFQNKCVYRVENDAEASPPDQKGQWIAKSKQQHTPRKVAQDSPIGLEWVREVSKNTAQEEMESPQTVGNSYGTAYDAALLHKTEARMVAMVSESAILTQ